MGLIPISLVPLVRGRGRWLMNVAAALGALVVMSMPGLMLSDLFFASVANDSGVDAAMTLYNDMGDEEWAVKSYLLPGLPSLLLCLPVAFAALARARRAPWWGVLAAVASLPVFAISMSALCGVVVCGALFGVLSWLVARATRV